MTFSNWLFYGLLLILGAAFILYLVVYSALVLQWAADLIKEPLVRRIVLGICILLGGVSLLGGTVILAIYSCYNSLEYLCWANELRNFLLYSPWLHDYAYFIIILGVGLWCGIDAWKRSAGKPPQRFGHATGEALEGLLIGGITVAPVLMFTYWALYRTLSWVLDWGYMKLPL